MRPTSLLAAAAMAFGILVVHAAPAGAQYGSAQDHPAARTCRGWSWTLAAGGPGALKVLTDQWLGGCPDIGPEALAATIGRVHAAHDVPLLWELTRQAAYLEHPRIFDAALALAEDADATVEARSAGLLILAGQLGSALGIEMPPDPTLHGEGLLTAPIPVRRFCVPTLAFITPADPAAVALSPESDRRAARVFDGLRTSTTVPERLRQLAHCLRGSVEMGVPPQIDVSGVRLAYVCETSFTLYNPTTLRLDFEIEVEGEPEGSLVRVLAGETHRFGVDTDGRVRVRYDGRVIQEVANGGTACR